MSLNRRYETVEDRKKVIEKIREVRYNGAFKHYKERFYIPDSSNAISEQAMKKLFTDYKMLDQVINAFVAHCPILETPTFETNSKKDLKKYDKKMELLKQAMKEIKWNELCTQIYDSLESEGDCFFYIYFDKNEEEAKSEKEYLIPKLKYLDSINIKNIVTDEANNPKSYIYKEKIYNEVVDYKTGDIRKENERDVVFIFEKGSVHRIDTGKSNEGGMLEKDKDGKIVVSKTTENMDFYKNEIPIIHIPSKKRQNEKFSVIPSEDYVELILLLAQIQSDIRATNRQLGFPRITLLDCKYVDGDGRIGGVRVAKTIVDEGDSNNYTDRQGHVIQHESATNESFFTEEKNVIDYLYNLVCITNPTLMNRVGSSDSSKVLQQVNMRMEKKIESYIDNIIEAFKVYFRILLSANNLYDEKKDVDISFKKPESIIKNSVYDENLITQQKLQNGVATIQSTLREQGKDSEYIDNHLNELNEEITNGKKDISVTKKGKSKQVDNAVKNANGADNLEVDN